MTTYKFQRVDLNKYRDEWVAFVNGKIIAHGKDLMAVSHKAERISKHPIYEKIPSHDTLVV